MSTDTLTQYDLRDFVIQDMIDYVKCNHAGDSVIDSLGNIETDYHYENELIWNDDCYHWCSTISPVMEYFTEPDFSECDNAMECLMVEANAIWQSYVREAVIDVISAIRKATKYLDDPTFVAETAYDVEGFAIQTESGIFGVMPH